METDEEGKFDLAHFPAGTYIVKGQGATRIIYNTLLLDTTPFVMAISQKKSLTVPCHG